MTELPTTEPAVDLTAAVYGDLPEDHLTSRRELEAARREHREIVADCGLVGPFRGIGVEPDGRPLCVRCAEVATADGAGWTS